jgi:hypothetical protein
MGQSGAAKFHADKRRSNLEHRKHRFYHLFGGYVDVPAEQFVAHGTNRFMCGRRYFEDKVLVPNADE